MRTTITIAVIALSCGVAALAVAAGWTSAEQKSEQYMRSERDLRKLTVKELQGVVDAICAADEDKRKLVGKNASKRVKDKVSSKYSALETIKDDAVALLDEVLADSKLAVYHDDASAYKKKLLHYWKRTGKMTKSVRGANHPVVAYLLDEGKKAHAGYQEDSDRCDVSEFSMKSGRVDCIKASTCTVIELKPDNKTAIRKGRRQAERYANELNERGDAYDKLVKKHGDVARCEDFTHRVDCYKLCPDIDAEGAFSKASPEWRSDCR